MHIAHISEPKQADNDRVEEIGKRLLAKWEKRDLKVAEEIIRKIEGKIKAGHNTGH